MYLVCIYLASYAPYVIDFIFFNKKRLGSLNAGYSIQEL